MNETFIIDTVKPNHMSQALILSLIVCAIIVGFFPLMKAFFST